MPQARELLNVKHLLSRPFGKGSSGGELKRTELAALFQRPKQALIYEPDNRADSAAAIAGIWRLLSSSTSNDSDPQRPRGAQQGLVKCAGGGDGLWV